MSKLDGTVVIISDTCSHLSARVVAIRKVERVAGGWRGPQIRYSSSNYVQRALCWGQKTKPNCTKSSGVQMIKSVCWSGIHSDLLCSCTYFLVCSVTLWNRSKCCLCINILLEILIISKLCFDQIFPRIHYKKSMWSVGSESLISFLCVVLDFNLLQGARKPVLYPLSLANMSSQWMLADVQLKCWKCWLWCHLLI